MTDFRLLTATDEPDVAVLLHEALLKRPNDTDFGMGAFENGVLIGCAFIKGDMIQGLAVKSDQQGEGVSAQLVSKTVKRAMKNGIRHLKIITKPEMAPRIEALGFRLVASAQPYAAFLEFGSHGIEEYLSKLQSVAENKPLPRAAIVMNANPFTLGHLALIQRAASECCWVFVIVVEEDVSEISYPDRLQMVKAGTAHLDNVSVLGGGDYCVSRATFPSYFTKEDDLAAAQSALDSAVFAEKIAPALGVSRRYIGTEPMSTVTEQYNRALKDQLPKSGIEPIEIPRIQSGSASISASRVRALLKSGDFASIEPLVPFSTYAFLREMRS